MRHVFPVSRYVLGAAPLGAGSDVPADEAQRLAAEEAQAEHLAADEAEAEA